MSNSAERRLRTLFPRLRSVRITSQADRKYNCIAWAVHNTEKWWEADSAPGYFWPPGVKREPTLDPYIQMFRQYGYVECDLPDYERGYEKVALYRSSTGFSHVARQLPDGQWTSKLGQIQDIEHDSLDELEGPGDAYGEVYCLLKRQLSNAEKEGT